jgi:hypothetical protein
LLPWSLVGYHSSIVHKEVVVSSSNLSSSISSSNLSSSNISSPSSNLPSLPYDDNPASTSGVLSAFNFNSSTIFNFDFGSLILDLINPASSLILYRFFVLHFALSFILLFLVIIHILLLHTFSSSSSLFNISSSIYISFSLFIIKDFLVFFIFYLSCFIYCLIFNFEFLSNPVNNIIDNNLSNPLNILPESYFLLFYCILRAIPNKFLGVIGTLCLLFWIFRLSDLRQVATSLFFCSSSFLCCRKTLFLFRSSFGKMWPFIFSLSEYSCVGLVNKNIYIRFNV